MMPLADKLIGLLVGVVVCAIFAVIIYFMAKKGNAKFDEVMETLSEDVKEKLVNSPIEGSPKKKGAIVQSGYLHQIQGDGNKVNLYIIYFNRYYPNCMNEFSYAELKASRKDLEENNITEGSFVKMQLSEDGGKLFI